MLSEWWVWVLNVHWSIENKLMGYCHLFVNAAQTSFAVLKYSHMSSELSSGCIHSLQRRLWHVLPGNEQKRWFARAYVVITVSSYSLFMALKKPSFSLYYLPFLAAVKRRFEQLNITAKISQENLTVAQRQHDHFHNEGASIANLLWTRTVTVSCLQFGEGKRKRNLSVHSSASACRRPDNSFVRFSRDWFDLNLKYKLALWQVMWSQ